MSFRWSTEDTQRTSLESLCKSLGYEFPEGWYNLSYNDIRNSDCYGLYQIHGSSFVKMFKTLYPNLDLTV